MITWKWCVVLNYISILCHVYLFPHSHLQFYSFCYCSFKAVMLSISTLPNQVSLFLIKTSFDKGKLAKITPNKTILEITVLNNIVYIVTNHSVSEWDIKAFPILTMVIIILWVIVMYGYANISIIIFWPYLQWYSEYAIFLFAMLLFLSALGVFLWKQCLFTPGTILDIII